MTNDTERKFNNAGYLKRWLAAEEAQMAGLNFGFGLTLASLRQGTNAYGVCVRGKFGETGQELFHRVLVDQFGQRDMIETAPGREDLGRFVGELESSGHREGMFGQWSFSSSVDPNPIMSLTYQQIKRGVVVPTWYLDRLRRIANG